MARKTPISSRAGFKLVELLVVLAMIAVLLCMVFPAIQKCRAASYRAHSQKNLKQITLATLKTIDDHDGRVPPAYGWYDIQEYGSPLFHILPNLGQKSIYDSAAKVDGVTYGYMVWNRPIRTYYGPGDPSADPFQEWTSYWHNNLAIVGDGLTGRNRYPASFTDGVSQTVFYTERYAISPINLGGGSIIFEGHRWQDECGFTPRNWGQAYQVAPPRDKADGGLPTGHVVGGIHISLGDGSVRHSPTGTRYRLFYEACTPSGGEGGGGDW